MISPTWFSETFGIVFAEAQAAGCHIVTSNLAGLREVVGDRGVLLEWDRNWQEANAQEPTAAYRAKFLAEVVRMMQNPNEVERERSRQYAKEHFGLDALADEWEAMLMSLVQEMEERVVPVFHDFTPEVAA